MKRRSGIRPFLALTVLVCLPAAMTESVYGQISQTAAGAQGVSQQASDRESNQPEQPAVQPSRDDSADATAFATIAEHDVSQLQKATTLTTWLNAAGKREQWTKIPKQGVTPTSQPGPECLGYWRTDALPSGAEVIRAIYFYPPPAPSPVAFPKGSVEELINTCVLAIVRVEAKPPVSDFGPALVREARSSEFGHAVDEAVRQRFTQLYGESIGSKDIPFWGHGSRLHRGYSRWIHNAEMVSGYHAQGSPCAFDELVLGPAAFVCGRSTLTQELKANPYTHHYRSVENEQFRRAVTLAQMNAALSEQLENLYEQVFQAGDSVRAAQPSNTKWRELFLPVLRNWIGALTDAPAPQRAAGLLAADHLLEAAQDAGATPGWPLKNGKRSELQELGAVFKMNGISGSYFYSGNWQEEAQKLDPRGQAGRMAMIGSMVRGSCDIAGWGSNLFDKIIHDGNALLASGLDPAIAAQVHFMVGDAYSTIFVIASGFDPNGDYPQIQESDSISARTKALDHYHAGLDIDHSTEQAKDAWRQAWHLAAGLVPDMRYACFGD